MYVLLVPNEPIKVEFDLKQGLSSEVFEDMIARSFWLLIAPKHLIGEEAPEWCLRLAGLVRQYRPTSTDKLQELINKVNTWYHEQYLNLPDQDRRAFLARMLAVSTESRYVEHVRVPKSAPA
jgi:hypothetical protein